MGIKVLSLFDGISCARVALDKAGIEVEKYYASEIDKYAIQVSEKNYPDIVQVGSVVDIKWNTPSQTNEPIIIDLIIGGSPCQDLSIAKKNREGLDGARSGLFYEFLRLINEIKPKYFVLENVNSMPKAAKATISEELFGIEPIMINAALVSAQNRKRLFWIGTRRTRVNSNDETETYYEQVHIDLPKDEGILLRDILESEVEDKYYLNNSSLKTLNRDSYGAKGSVAEPDGKTKTLTASAGGGGGNGIHVKNLRNGDEKAVSMTASMHKGYGNDGVTTVRVGNIGTKSMGMGGGHVPMIVGAASRTYPRTPNGQPREKRIELRKDDKANSMTSVQGDSMVAIIPEATKKGYAVATDGQSVDLSFPTSKTRRGRVGDKAKNLMTSSNIGVFTGGAIRKLTPIECERLQGLPDNYTEGISNSQRYKSLGNGFNADVVTHIIKSIYG